MTGKKESRNKVPQARSAGEYTINIELTVTSKNFSSKMVRPSCQSRIEIKFVKLKDQR